METRFHDRFDAGRRLAVMLEEYGSPGRHLPPLVPCAATSAGQAKAIVLALPRGGVPVGYEVARALGLPLDVFMVRKLGVPGYEELAMGAIASGGARVLNPGVVRRVDDAEAVLEEVTAREATELERRERAYRGDRPALELRGPVGHPRRRRRGHRRDHACGHRRAAAAKGWRDRRRCAGGRPEVCARLRSEARLLQWSAC